MNAIEEYFVEIIKLILTMTFTGSIVSIFLFAIKPMIKERLPKSFQYYMWFPVIIALILPLSKIVVISAPGSSEMPIKSMHDIAQKISDTAFERPVTFGGVSQVGNKQNILQTTAHFPSIATMLFIFWLLGMIVVLSFNIICYALYVRKLKKYNISADKQEMELLNKLSGSKNTPRLYKNSIVATPILMGVFRPEIILPYKEYEEMKLQGILLHEITHMRKYDIVIKWLLILAGALHWFNPIIYFVRLEISKACELACDESVIKKFDNDGRQHYGDSLIMVAADTIRKIPVSVTMFEDKKNLKERLNAIMKYKDFSKKTIYLSCILFIIIICGTFYFGIARSSMNMENGDTITYTDETPIQRQKHKKEIEVKQALCDYDKDNIVGVWVFLAASDDDIISANILVVSNDEITDVDEQDKIKAVASESLNLDVQKISLEYMDKETFLMQGSQAKNDLQQNLESEEMQMLLNEEIKESEEMQRILNENLINIQKEYEKQIEELEKLYKEKEELQKQIEDLENSN